MKSAIYKPIGSNGFELCLPVRDDDYETIVEQINGVRREGTWRPIPVNIVRESEGKKLLQSDAPWPGTSHGLIFRKSAVNRMGARMRECGELLPLECSDAELVIFNATRVIDALDEDASKLSRLNDGTIMRISQFVFRTDVIKGVDMFKIPNMRASPVFVSERFVREWNESGLQGMDFKKIWPVVPVRNRSTAN